ncbi:MAG: PKD domain-containing protein [Gillisia sp.]|nr:PKD domain-containing protein [Gillisia sp.]
METKIHNYIFIAILSMTLFACQKDDVTPPQSQAEFTASATQVMVGEEIQFTNTSQNATAYSWSFGDGTTSNQVAPRKSYATSNVFLVSLVSTGAGGSTISNKEITVTPASTFTVEDDENLVATVPVQFTNTSVGAESYAWSFGDADNSTSTDENPNFTYPNSGTYTVSLTASSAYGDNTFTKEVTIGEAPAASASLYYIDFSDDFIRKLKLDGSGTVDDVLNVAGKSGAYMAYDAVNEKVYWTDFTNAVGSNNIWRMDLDGTNAEIVVSNLGNPYGIAIDKNAEKIYWVDNKDGTYGTVSKADLDGSNPDLDFYSLGGDSQWSGISLDVENSRMYLYDYWIEDIHSVNMDGTDDQIILPGIGYGYSMFVDTVNDKLYFDEWGTSENLFMSNLDGSNVQEVNPTLGSRVYGIDVDYENGKLYYSGRDSGELYKSNLDGSNLEVLKSGLSSPRGIVLIK